MGLIRMKESIAGVIYDFGRAEPFAPFTIRFASGQRFEIKSRDYYRPGTGESVRFPKTTIGDRLGRIGQTAMN